MLPGMNPEQLLDRVAEFIASDQCKSVVFLTGAGMSVGAGIPDFRSAGGMFDTLRPTLLTASAAERSLMENNPTAVVSSDLFAKNPLPYFELRRPFILGTEEGKWRATLAHRFVEQLQKKFPQKLVSKVVTPIDTQPPPYLDLDKVIYLLTRRRSFPLAQQTRLYTQNIDGLDYQCSSSTGRADDKSGGEEGEFGGKGAIPPEKIVPVHGSMARLLCESCGAEDPIGLGEFCGLVRSQIKDIYDESPAARAKKSTPILCPKCGAPAL